MLELLEEHVEEIDGRMCRVRRYRHGKNFTETVEPIRSPEEQEKRDTEIAEAFRAFARGCIRVNGYEWAREHLAVEV